MMTRAQAMDHPLTPPLPLTGCDWSGLWKELQRVFRALDYRPGTLRLYRAVLRGLARSSRLPPDRIGRTHIDYYLRGLAYRHRSASWLAMNLSVLRNVFDRCCAHELLGARRGPRRPHRLPETLSTDEVSSLFRAAASPRDALLLAVLYGCGLKPGEAARLRWGQFDPETGMLRIDERELPAPEAARALLRAGRERCGPEAFVFAGRVGGRPLATRTVSRIVRETVRAAALNRPVCAMMLRHSYAVHQLQASMNVRALQDALGLRDLAGALRYAACSPPSVSSPMDSPADQAPCEEPAVAPIPEIAVEEAAPPFPAEHPRRYFLAWLRASLRRGVRRLRLSG
jgi:integrase/recombinase XerD